MKSPLDELYNRYNHKDYIKTDPIYFPHLFTTFRDKELIALISSCFAYGKISLFGSILQKLIDKVGSPFSEKLVDKNKSELSTITSDLYYRFYTNIDIFHFLTYLQKIYRKNEHYELFILSKFKHVPPSVFEISDFISSDFLSFLQERNIKKTFGNSYFFPMNGSSSASKRMLMFLRWMVRKDEIDLGLWKLLSPTDLIIPLDTHTGRITYYLGLHENDRSSKKEAICVTQNLKFLDALDPVKYDFSISRMGILKNCPRQKNLASCGSCNLISICQR